MNAFVLVPCISIFNLVLDYANINDCKPRPCKNSGICNDLVNDYKCDCATGYSGKNCETGGGVVQCNPNPCNQGGTCTQLHNDYKCQCPLGYTGKSCQTDINDCKPRPCKNGGVCTDLVNDYKCDCATDYRGKNCETVESHKDIPCQNGGTMSTRPGYLCDCNSMWTGLHCERPKKNCSVTYTQCNCTLGGTPWVFARPSSKMKWSRFLPAMLGTLGGLAVGGAIGGLLYLCWKKCAKLPQSYDVTPSSTKSPAKTGTSPPSTSHNKNIYRATFGDQMLHRTAPKKYSNTYANGSSDWIG